MLHATCGEMPAARVLPGGEPADAGRIEGADDGSFGVSVAIVAELDGGPQAELAVGDHLHGTVSWTDDRGAFLYAIFGSGS